MDTSWWPALAAAVAVALVAVVAGLRRPGGRARPPGRPGRPRGPGGPVRAPQRKPLRMPQRTPQPGEIWWAAVPYEDGPGAKDRPCLVLSVRGGSSRVAKITSRYHDERPGVIALPPGVVGDPQGRPSFLETGELRDVPLWEFRRRVGPVDPTLWDQVRHLAG
ncbi:type II toxin-antitoxin system PemK/MazF family toxin [Streptomyces sp. A3M-1-3]|uniref:type II toxin-antitoxin system PemK/MazF family toxin n=1 Tax=Streptomyces sp. A3M-1-3 TaxID=2962044 RepID=UPI0020B8C193|nr:type II toxin-antitoxin system PemK/MazF family toxin [Streptomyces sp. A3M-1-3]MCP3819468.1 type II toxin-antitoxin system PemK/MazF family toxin [Streptomyces sp. A3M-1-3]